MRCHSLTLTAFGPYAGTEVVDFEALNEAGVFLMTGPMGAGKTSLLDAVCFALYGVVPGERGVKTLRSHHAAPDAQPEVVLEVTLAGRRLRIHRSPEWWRPKKRGHGTTRQQASARLVDLSDGTERLVSARVGEVGHELSLLLGMSSEQFMQVVMLPQGQFQTFLRATSDERQRVLQRLFATERFARIEDWMQHRARVLKDRSVEGERHLGRLLGAVANRTGAALPDSLTDLARGEATAVERDALSWSGRLLAEAEDRAARAAAAVERSADDVSELAARLAEVEGAFSLARARDRARATLGDLERRTEEVSRARALLDAHDRAGPVAPLASSVASLVAEVEAARTASLATSAAGPGLDPGRPLGIPRLRRLRDEVTSRTAELRSSAPVADELRRARGQASAAAAQVTALEERREELTEQADVLPARLRALDQELATTAALAGELTLRREAVQQAERRHQALRDLGQARDVAQRHGLDALTAREAAVSAREQHLDLLERRLQGMAAELARQLVTGEPCDVCGSREHPAPARTDGSVVTAADQETAAQYDGAMRAAADRARAEAEEAAVAVRLLEQQAGEDDADAVAADLARRRADLAAGEAAATRMPDLERRQADTATAAAELAVEIDDVRTRRAEAETRREAELRAAEAAAAALAEVLGDHTTLDGALRDAGRRLEELDAALAAEECLADAESRLATATAQARSVAVSQGFADVDTAVEACLPTDQWERLSMLLREVERLRADAERVVQDAAVTALADCYGDDGPPDPGPLSAAVRQARATADQAAAERVRAEELREALTSLAAQLRQAFAAWTPDQQRHQTAAQLSQLVRGMGSDNQLQMRLSSYVLATRLDQVLDAANERLGQMRDHRYELQRTGLGRGGSRAGLGLEVLDGWTGECRDPATLSGGETFVVSLALALGLADVVAEESGGTRVDTLFVDEGFSALDPDTLDDVMDRIDALRSGGRTVGVVSHVTELRARIPVQLHVERSRSGSTVRSRTTVA